MRDVTVDVRVDAREAVPIIVTHKLCVDQPRVYRTTNCIDSLLNVTVSSSWTKYHKKDLKILRQAPPPSCLPSRLPNVTHVTLFPRPSPSVFAYSMRSKTGGGNSLGTRLGLVYHELQVS